MQSETAISQTTSLINYTVVHNLC